MGVSIGDAGLSLALALALAVVPVSISGFAISVSLSSLDSLYKSTSPSPLSFF